MELAIDTAQTFDMPNNGGGNAATLQTDIVTPGSNLQVQNQVDQIVSAPAGANYLYSGQVVDSTNEQPIPYASVVLYDAIGNQINGQSADVNGNFNLPANQDAANISISASGYIPFTFPASEYQHVFELERTADLPGVTITTKKSDSSWILLLLIPLVLKEKKKGISTIGKLQTSDVCTIILIAAALLGWGVINKLLQSAGIFTGPGSQSVHNEQVNPASPWKPDFYKNSPPGSLLLYHDTAVQMANDIFDSFGVTQDDFEKVFGVFSQLRTQSQVSYLADVFSQQDFSSMFGITHTTGLDLLTFLTNGGGLLPWDGLSDTHLKI